MVEDATQIDWISWHFGYVGLTDFAGYLTGGMKAWDNAGLPLKRLPQLPVQELAERRDEFQLLDVRSPAEFKKNRIAGAKHMFVADMRDGIEDSFDMDRSQPVAVYCGSGYRANMAASILQNHRFEKVHNVPGSLQAWKAAGFDVES